jgi:hypothetical protein
MLRGVHPNGCQAGYKSLFSIDGRKKIHIEGENLGDGLGSRRTEGDEVLRRGIFRDELVKDRPRSIHGDGACQRNVRRARAAIVEDLLDRHGGDVGGEC